MYNDASRVDADFPVKHMTNVEFVTWLMEYSKYGALVQLFILDAIERRAADIADLDVADLAEVFGENSFVNPVAWHGVATEINDKFKARQT